MEQISILERVKQQFAALIGLTDSQFGEDIIVFKPEARDQWLDICKYLHDQLGLHQLSFLAGVDLLDRRPKPAHNCRYELVYQLYSMANGSHLRVKLPLAGENGLWAPSVTLVWRGAELLENETYDMFGIIFEGHPDLRRIYLPEDWEGHPLRKDYPLKGNRPRGERYQR